MRDHTGIYALGANMQFARGVHLLETFDDNMNWTVDGTGGDQVAALATAAALHGANGCHLMTRTTATADDDYISIARAIGWPESGKLVMRARLALHELTGTKHVTCYFNLYDGAHWYQFALTYNKATGKCYYTDAAGAAVELTALAQVVPADMFAYVDLVVDVGQMEYVSVAFNGVRAALAGVPGWEVAASTDRAAKLMIMATSTATGPADVYVDSVYCGEFEEL